MLSDTHFYTDILKSACFRNTKIRLWTGSFSSSFHVLLFINNSIYVKVIPNHVNNDLLHSRNSKK